MCEIFWIHVVKIKIKNVDVLKRDFLNKETIKIVFTFKIQNKVKDKVENEIRWTSGRSHNTRMEFTVYSLRCWYNLKLSSSRLKFTSNIQDLTCFENSLQSWFSNNFMTAAQRTKNASNTSCQMLCRKNTERTSTFSRIEFIANWAKCKVRLLSGHSYETLTKFSVQFVSSLIVLAQ